MNIFRNGNDFGLMVYIADKSVATAREKLFLKELELNTQGIFFADLAHKEEKFGTAIIWQEFLKSCIEIKDNIQLN